MTTEILYKRCSTCKKTKPISQFSSNTSKKDGLAFSCKPCHSAISRKHYLANKPKFFERNQITRERIRQALQELKTGPCMDCGGTFDPFIMEFDHRDPETKNFSMSCFGTRSIKTVKAEIAKCDLVCANCHKLRTRKRHNIGGDRIQRFDSVPTLNLLLDSEGSTLSN